MLFATDWLEQNIMIIRNLNYNLNEKEKNL